MLDTYKQKLGKLILTVESELKLHMHDRDYIPTNPLMAATLFNHNPALRLFSYECEHNMYRVWYEAKLEPSKDTFPVHSPTWAPMNNESKEENKELRFTDENIRPEPQKVLRQPPKVPQQPQKVPRHPPPSQPTAHASSQPSAPIQYPTTTPYLPPIQSAVSTSDPALRAPAAATSLAYCSRSSETISRFVHLSTLNEVSTMASAVLLRDGNLFTCGGNEPISSDVHLINPITGLVNRLASMKYQRYAHGLAIFR